MAGGCRTSADLPDQHQCLGGHMLHKKTRAYTLIEMMLVLAIMSVMAVLVFSEVSSSRIRATNAIAKGDITQLAKAVDVWRLTQSELERVMNARQPYGGTAPYNNRARTYVNGTGGNPGDDLCATTLSSATYPLNRQNCGWRALFNSINKYPVVKSSTPSSVYTYGYSTNIHQNTLSLIGTTATATSYCIGTNVQTSPSVMDGGFYIQNGDVTTKLLNANVEYLTTGLCQ
jgi:prepilin-type N-terminal cleavage/methylation domain-containing protein